MARQRGYCSPSIPYVPLYFIAFLSVWLDQVASFSQWTLSRSGMYYLWVKEVKNQDSGSPCLSFLAEASQKPCATDEKLQVGRVTYQPGPLSNQMEKTPQIPQLVLMCNRINKFCCVRPKRYVLKCVYYSNH